MKTSRIALLLALLAACAVAALLVLGNPASKKRNYTLGAIGNFKGKNAQVGVEAFNAINLAYAEYKDTHPNGFNLNILSVDDSWEPSKSLPAYLSCISNVDLLIILTGSSSFMLIYDEVLKHPDILHYALGPTTTLLSGKKDNVVRNLCDMEKEQKMIAEFASSRKFERLLIVTETDFNAKYTEPAARYFQQYAHIPIVDVVGFSGNLMDMDKAKELLQANHYDAMYALIGGMPRESAILIPLLFGVMYFDRLPLRKLLLVGTALVAIYAAVSWAVSLTLGDNLSYYGPNSLASLHKYGKWRLFINLAWLNYSIRNYLVLLATLGGLPLVFLAFLRWIPAHLRGFGLVALFYFELLACVGNLYESRIFGEIVTLLYIPAALGGCRYLRAGMPLPDFQPPGQANSLNPFRPGLEIAAAVILMGLLIALGIVLKAIPAPYTPPVPF